MKEYISIGEAAKLLGLSIDTIRYYEKIKIIPPIKRKSNSYRMISMSDLLYLRGVSYLRTCGMSLEKIKDLSLNPSMRTQVMDESLEALDKKIKSLQESKKFLKGAKEELLKFEKKEISYSYEHLTNYYFEKSATEVTLNEYLMMEDIVYELPLSKQSSEVNEGYFVTHEPIDGFSLKDFNFITKAMEFEGDKKVNQELTELINEANRKGHQVMGKAFLIIYAKASCFCGSKLAGKLLLAIEKGEKNDSHKKRI